MRWPMASAASNIKDFKRDALADGQRCFKH